MRNMTITVILPHTVLPHKIIAVSVPSNAKGTDIMSALSKEGHIGEPGSTYALVRRKLHDGDTVQVFEVDPRVSGTQTVPQAEAEIYYFGSSQRKAN